MSILKWSSRSIEAGAEIENTGVGWYRLSAEEASEEATDFVSARSAIIVLTTSATSVEPHPTTTAQRIWPPSACG